MLLHHFLLSECRPGLFPAGFSIFRVKCCRTVNRGQLKTFFSIIELRINH